MMAFGNGNLNSKSSAICDELIYVSPRMPFFVPHAQVGLLIFGEDRHQQDRDVLVVEIINHARAAPLWVHIVGLGRAGSAGLDDVR